MRAGVRVVDQCRKPAWEAQIVTKPLIALIALALSCPCASAEPFEAMYDNTATSTSPTGKTTTYYFNRDGTFENRFPSGKIVRGTFVWRDAQTACFTVTDPPSPPGQSSTNCKTFPVAHKVGDTWTETDSEGVAYTNSIKPGR